MFETVAVTSGVTPIQFVMARFVVNWRRYVSPGIVVHVTFTQSFVRLIPVMSGRETTVTAKDRESESEGTPLSVTVMEKLFVVSASSSVVGHENNPDDGWMFAPEAAPEARL